MIKVIKYDFQFYLTYKVPREVLKAEGEARGFQHFPSYLNIQISLKKTFR